MHDDLRKVLGMRAEGRHLEARKFVAEAVQRQPKDAELQYQAACVHDFLGFEKQAVAYYRSALHGPLSAASLEGTFLGLGSTYRNIGRYADAVKTLNEGLKRFPNNRAMAVFLALAQYNAGEAKLAVESLATLLAQTSSDASIQAHARAIVLYAEDVDKRWD
jgi:tetratricopeptide (TPR) repeat protein